MRGVGINFEEYTNVTAPSSSAYAPAISGIEHK